MENYYGINTNTSNTAKTSTKSSSVWQREVSLTDFIVIVLTISHDGGDDDKNEQNIMSCIKQCMDSDHSSYLRLKTSQSKQKIDFASVLQKVRRVAQHKNYIKASNDACEIFLNEPLTLVNIFSKKLKKFNVLFTHMDVNNGLISGSFSPRMFVDGLRMIDCRIDDYGMEEDIVESFLKRGYKHIESTESFVCIIFDLISPWEKNAVQLSGDTTKAIADHDNEAQWQKKIGGAVDLRIKLGLLYSNADARLERPIFRFEDFLYTLIVYMLYPLSGIFDAMKRIREYRNGKESRREKINSVKSLIYASCVFITEYLGMSFFGSFVYILL